MDSLLKYYEVELALLKALSQDFSARYPALAGRLGMQGDGAGDPHVERLIQASAMLSARTAKRLDDSHGEFIESLLELNFPHYLRPFPSCSIVRVDTSGHAGDVATIPRGTIMRAVEHEGVLCKFSTAFDVTVSPLYIAEARYEPLINAPKALRLPPCASAVISLTIASNAAAVTLDTCGLNVLRLYIDGTTSLAAALRDTLFTRLCGAYLQTGQGATWQALAAAPLAAVGYASDEALIPFQPGANHAYRLLTEYFCCPEKFNFVDIELGAIAALLPAACKCLTLHLLVGEAPADADLPALLRPLNRQHLLTACTPVVNLFRQAARPIIVNHQSTDYPLVAESRQPQAFEIHSVNSVTMLRKTGTGSKIVAFHPMYSVRHGDAGGRRGHYWLTRRNEARAITNPGHETTISFVDIDMRADQAATETVSVELSCTNRDLPCRLPIGAAGGDLQHEAAASELPVRLLRKPGQPYRFATGKALQWRLLSQLALGQHSLTQGGLAVFKEILELYNLPDSPVVRRQIDGLTGLSHRRGSTWVGDASGGSLVYGIDVLLTVDESAYVAGGLYCFAQVIDHFLGLYVQLNSYTRLIVNAQHSGKELLRCPPRNGHQALA